MQLLITRIALAVSLATVFSMILPGQPNQRAVLSVPGSAEYCKSDAGGVSVLPSGRYVKPAGRFISITHDPFGLAISPDNKKAVTLHNGVFTVIDLESFEHTRVPAYDGTIRSPLQNGSFLGVAFSADSKTVFLSGGDNGAVIIYDIYAFRKLDSISLNGKINGEEFSDSFTSDLMFNQNNNELLVLDRANYRMVRIDLNTRRITASIKTGRLPFGLAMDPGHKLAFVANVGMYAYPLIEGATPANYDSLLISHHPYADNSKESIGGTIVEGRKAPGVGSPLAPEAMSVFIIDLSKNKVIHKIKTGYQVGQMIEETEVVGGASPNSIAVGTRYADILPSFGL